MQDVLDALDALYEQELARAMDLSTTSLGQVGVTLGVYAAISCVRETLKKREENGQDSKATS